MGFTGIVLFIHERYMGMWPDFGKGVNVQVHSSFGVVLGFLIVYQSGQSSKRWWEARCCWEILWGKRKRPCVYLQDTVTFQKFCPFLVCTSSRLPLTQSISLGELRLKMSGGKSCGTCLRRTT